MVTNVNSFSIYLFIIVFTTIQSVSSRQKDINVVYAVNAGGNSYVDRFGVKYMQDPLKEGTASDYGKRYSISKVPGPDQILYQTERYSENSLEYQLPIQGDGEYVLVLKFSEVYFHSSGQKV